MTPTVPCSFCTQQTDQTGTRVWDSMTVTTIVLIAFAQGLFSAAVTFCILHFVLGAF